MRKLIYLSLITGVLAAVGTSCSIVANEVKPTPATPPPANTQIAFSYQQYTTLPEPIGYIAGGGKDQTYGSTAYKIPFVLGQSLVTGGHPIYSYNPVQSNGQLSPTAGRWQRVAAPSGYNGGLMKLAVDPYDNNTFGIDDQQHLWVIQPSTGWYDTGQLATDVVVGAGRRVYFLGTTPVTGGYRIYRLTPPSGNLANPSYAGLTAEEVLPGSAATTISSDDFGRLWVVNSLHQIFCNTSPHTGGSFEQLTGAGVDIACDLHKSVGLIGDRFLNHGYEIFVRDGTTPTTSYEWNLQSGDATQIRGNKYSGGFYVLNDLGEVFYASYAPY